MSPLIRAEVDDFNRLYWIFEGDDMKSKYCVKYDSYVSDDYQECENCTRCAEGRG